MAIRRVCDWCGQKIRCGEGRALANGEIAWGAPFVLLGHELEVTELCDSCWKDTRAQLLRAKDAAKHGRTEVAV